MIHKDNLYCNKMNFIMSVTS